ncbi:hypothetical protein PEP31012_03376 [Pandoraea eparura]|uniref:Transglycosylase n=1 Tax=Pandoraea eparura TaxID=2508291 RepID=A0A5E4WR28_9BURK|nr:GlsB/YeaQ/YmgE family stress response membrane protein [Pandoraea eparura]VVE25456.1 hypothetical protein PEP31012_03376 [Pandoraea eparura]
MEHDVISWIVAGGIAGWVTGRLMRSGGFGLIIDVVVGMMGGLLGGWMTTVIILGASGQFMASVVTAFGCAVLVLHLVRPLKPDYD